MERMSISSRSISTLCCCACEVCLLFAASDAAAQIGPDRLGTLFYSPAERTAIVAARRKELEGSATASASNTLVVTGLVKRNNQKGTVWINGAPVVEGQAIPSAGLPQIESGRVIIDGKPLRVREGYDLENGIRTDALPQGAVGVKPAK